MTFEITIISRKRKSLYKQKQSWQEHLLYIPPWLVSCLWKCLSLAFNSEWPLAAAFGSHMALRRTVGRPGVWLTSTCVMRYWRYPYGFGTELQLKIEVIEVFWGLQPWPSGHGGFIHQASDLKLVNTHAKCWAGHLELDKEDEDNRVCPLGPDNLVGDTGIWR